jgi:hypothetical protein
VGFPGSNYKPKTTKKKVSLYYTYDNMDIKRVSWCMDKNIHVAVTPRGSKWKIEIRMNKGEWNADPGIYEHQEAMKKMYEYYKYYYDKYNKQ